MKRITLLALGLLISGISFGQQILSHSTDNQTVVDGGVACAGGGTTTDNIYSRSYTPVDFGYEGDFVVLGARFFPTFTDVSGGAEAVFTVRFSTSDGVYPAGTLTVIGETTLTVTITQDKLEQEVFLEAPITVDASTEIIVEIDIPDNIEPNEFDARIGVNDAGQSGTSYIFAIGCGITAATDFADIGFPDNHIILDLMGDGDLLSVGENATLSNNISLFPTPTNGDLNNNFARNFGTTSIAIFNVNGQKVLNTSTEGFGNNTIATSTLVNGIYFAQVVSQEGTSTMKFIKN